MPAASRRSSMPAKVRIRLPTHPPPPLCFPSTDSHTTAEFKDKKVVIVAVPGAFTPTCSEKHIPTFIEQKDALKAKGIDQIVVIAFNDPWVMSAWGKSHGITDDWIVSSPSTPKRDLVLPRLEC